MHAALFTWGGTALGASVVFFFKRINRKVLDGVLGFAAEVMVAASFWLLPVPAIGMVESEDLANTNRFQGEDHNPAPPPSEYSSRHIDYSFLMVTL